MKLTLVATPIGNLGDLSSRAAEALREADLWLVEDTRVSGKLQAALGIVTLLAQAPLALALAHQGMAMVVLTVAVVHAERLAHRDFATAHAVTHSPWR